MTKILIIEDTEDLRVHIAEVLTLEGFQVISAADGNEGVKQVRKHLPDLILCDIMMPGKDGFDVIRQLKLDGLLDVPFIYITALGERQNIRAGMDIGADDYLVKPFTIKELFDAIQSRLNKFQTIQRRFENQIREIEEELKAKIDELKSKNKNNDAAINKFSDTKATMANQLEEKQALLKKEVFRSIEVSNTLKSLSDTITNEINRIGIDDKQKLTLIKLKNKIARGPVLLDNWTYFQLEFSQIYPLFTSRFITKYPKLTQQDLTIISALRINLNTHQISAILGISPDSVRKSKYRLKKKLDLGIDDDLFFEIHNMNT